MSKKIKITVDEYKDIYQEFLRSLRSTRVSGGKVTFTKTFDTIKRRATIIFSEQAWLKMSSIVEHCDKEVAWHATAHRDEDEAKDIYYVDDILVYPQEVTGATVTTDQDEYETWLNKLSDETFNSLRFQGHSHVNMQTNPSSVDTAFYDGILDGLADDDFYIFMIVNKRGNRTVMIYDYKKNVLFETSDCDIEIEDGEYALMSFVDEVDSMVKEKKYTAAKTPATSTNYGASSYGGSYGSSYGGSYGGYGGYNSTYNNNNNNTKPAATATPAATTQAKTPATTGANKPAAKDEKKETPPHASLVSGGQNVSKKTGKRKGKRKERIQKGRNLYDYVEC